MHFITIVMIQVPYSCRIPASLINTLLLRGNSMRKWIVILSALLLVIAVVALVTGCSSDEQQAKKYMKKGDGQLQDFQSKAAAWSAKINALSADPATISGEVQQVEAAGAELLKTRQAAKAEYEKILRLSNPGDYREYADLRIAEADILEQMILKMHEFLDRRVAMVISKDLSNYPALQQQVQDEISPLVEKGQGLEQKADKLKSDAGL